MGNEKEKIVIFEKRVFEADDDSFSYWKIKTQVPKELFKELLREKAIWYEDPPTPEAKRYFPRGILMIDPVKAKEVLTRHGYIAKKYDYLKGLIDL